MAVIIETLGLTRAMGWETKTGVIEAGALADLVSMDLNGSWHQPMGDISRHILYYENGSSVADVWVNGQRVVKSQKLTTVDLDSLMQEASEIVAKRRESIPISALQTIEAQYPAFRGMILRTLQSDHGTERRFNLI